MSLRNLIIATVFSLFSTLNAQVMADSLMVENADEVIVGGFGGPIIKVIHPMGSRALMVGGQGAVVFNRMFAIGAFGQGMAGNIDFDGNNYGYDQDLELQMGFGGFFLEYSPCRKRTLHPSFSLPVGFGGASVNTKDTGENISRSAIFTLSPRLNLELNLGENMVLAFFGGYQFMNAQPSFLISSDKLSSWEYGVNYKVGLF